MGITFTSSEITIIGGNYTFEDIYQASVDAGNTYCKKIGTAYLISIDIILGDEETETELSGENISVIIEGDLFQITKNSVLRLGTYDYNTEATSKGVYLSCPNIANGYGFGSKNRIDGVTQSGNIFIYDSFIDIYGFWGFFGGPDQHCEIIDCLVNGYGRVEGTNTVLKNIVTQKSQGRYGVLAAKGTIKTYENISSKASEEYKGHTCSVYFNPNYAPGMRVIGGTYDGYIEGLVYAEPNDSGVTKDGIITFVDSDIRNGFGAYYSDSSTGIEVRYTFNPIFKDENNNTMSDVNVTIIDNNGVEAFSGLSNSDGEISTELLFHSENSSEAEDISFYDIMAEKGDVSVTRRYVAGVTYKQFPFFVVAGSGGTSSEACSCDDITVSIDSLLNNKLAELQSSLEQKIEDVAGTTITNIDNSINDSHDRIKIAIKDSENVMVDVIINGDGESVTNNDLLYKIDDILNRIQEIEIDLETVSDEIETTSNGWKII